MIAALSSSSLVDRFESKQMQHYFHSRVTLSALFALIATSLMASTTSVAHSFSLPNESHNASVAFESSFLITRVAAVESKFDSIESQQSFDATTTSVTEAENADAKEDNEIEAEIDSVQSRAPADHRSQQSNGNSRRLARAASQDSVNNYRQHTGAASTSSHAAPDAQTDIPSQLVSDLAAIVIRARTAYDNSNAMQQLHNAMRTLNNEYRIQKSRYDAALTNRRPSDAAVRQQCKSAIGRTLRDVVPIWMSALLSHRTNERQFRQTGDAIRVRDIQSALARAEGEIAFTSEIQYSVLAPVFQRASELNWKVDALQHQHHEDAHQLEQYKSQLVSAANAFGLRLDLGDRS